MNILFIMDPLGSCDLRWDNSLHLLSELDRRKHDCWITDTRDLQPKGKKIYSRSRNIRSFSKTFRKRVKFSYKVVGSKIWDLEKFDLILIRKNPPVDRAYLEAMKLLEKIASKVPFVNHPKGIRKNNEKLAILNFPRWIPKSFVSNSPEKILHFQKRIKKSVVVKPLNQKGGKGIFILPLNRSNNLSRLRRATQRGTIEVMAQEFLKVKSGEKRIVLLNGDLLCVYEKRAKRDFRANLSLGASFHRTTLLPKEKKLCRELKPFLRKQGLFFVGLDVLDGKLIEINGTSPAGVTEAMHLWPGSRFVEVWADFLEDFSHSFRQP